VRRKFLDVEPGHRNDLRIVSTKDLATPRRSLLRDALLAAGEVLTKPHNHIRPPHPIVPDEPAAGPSGTHGRRGG
jgi:hypothetical protein